VILLLALVVGGLYTAGLFLMLQRSITKLIFGLVLLGHAANLLIFSAAGMVKGNPPLVAEGATVPPAGHADPVPQALILTAIVIGFAVLAFAAVLVRQVYATLGTDDSDRMRSNEA
jgi:multicomponent Na+:H+ antiporter subunit C